MAINNQNIRVEYAGSPSDAPPTVIKKRIPVNNEFIETKFIKLYNNRLNKKDYGKTDMEEWCREKYGGPKYLGHWFKTGDYIIMKEETYFLWQLSK